jgi:Protein of unknown function (DUF2628)
VALQVVLALVGASAFAKFVTGLLFAILVGLEAGSLRRWTFGRRGWTELGVVVADDINMAERRFFDAWASGAASSPLSAAPRAPGAPPGAPVAARATPDVLGLFPRPGAQA